MECIQQSALVGWGVLIYVFGFLSALIIWPRRRSARETPLKPPLDREVDHAAGAIKAALDWYANKGNWHRLKGPRGARSWANCLAMEDKGARARRALTGDLFDEAPQ